MISSRREGNINKRTKLKSILTLDRRSVSPHLPAGVRALRGQWAIWLAPRLSLATESTGTVLIPSQMSEIAGHAVGGQLPRVFFSALPGQSSDRPNLPPHKKLSIFQFPFASIRRATSEACSGLGKRRIDRSTSKRSSKKLQRATITAFFLDRSLVVVHCDRS